LGRRLPVLGRKRYAREEEGGKSKKEKLYCMVKVLVGVGATNDFRKATGHGERADSTEGGGGGRVKG